MDRDTKCPHCSLRINSTDNFCRSCGGATLTKPPSNLSHTTLLQHWTLRRNLFVVVLFAIVALTTFTVSEETDNEEYGKSAGMWHKVGELFNREQQRQRKMKHSTADEVENGPKEISIFCPQDPVIRIMDLSEDERDRDECLVLNIAAPDVSSRLVLFCNAHSMKTESSDEENDGDMDEETIPSEEL